MPPVLAAVELRVVDRQGDYREVTATPGQPLMYALRDAALDIEASCGGCCICATCHVHLEGDWPGWALQPAVDERQLLDELLHTGPRSRLACQLTVTEALQGLTVRIAPPEL